MHQQRLQGAVSVVPTQRVARVGSHASAGRYRAPARRARPAAGRYRSAPETSSPPLARMDTGPVVVTAVASTVAVVAYDLALTERLSMFFDLCFVLIGLTAAMVVRRRGFFAVGVLPPLLLGTVVAVLAVLTPSALTPTHLAFISTWLTGLAHHGTALVVTHTVVLAVIGARVAR